MLLLILLFPILAGKLATGSDRTNARYCYLFKCLHSTTTTADFGFLVLTAIITKMQKYLPSFPKALRLLFRVDLRRKRIERLGYALYVLFSFR